jgi:hypothetical protein
MEKKKTSKIVPPNVKVMFLPMIYIIILLVVSIFAVRTGLDRIGKQRRELKAVQKVENTLMEKEAELRSSVSVNPPLVTPATMALPDTNPALMVISNMKALTATRAVSIQDMRFSSGASGDAELNGLRVTFTINGEFDEAVNFMTDVKTYIPILRFDSILVDIKDEFVSFDTSGQSYWASYPEKLPPITEPIDKITQEEYAVLNELTQKQTPAFFELTPTGPAVRSDPFSF